MEKLLALQKLDFDHRSRQAAPNEETEKLRKSVPAQVLAHYDRMASRGKKGVAIACGGVCSECHLRITSGKLVHLVYTDELEVCDNCGRYLYLPDDEPIGLTEPRPLKPISSSAFQHRV